MKTSESRTGRRPGGMLPNPKFPKSPLANFTVKFSTSPQSLSPLWPPKSSKFPKLERSPKPKSPESPKSPKSPKPPKPSKSPTSPKSPGSPEPLNPLHPRKTQKRHPTIEAPWLVLPESLHPFCPDIYEGFGVLGLGFQA